MEKILGVSLGGISSKEGGANAYIEGLDKFIDYKHLIVPRMILEKEKTKNKLLFPLYHTINYLKTIEYIKKEIEKNKSKIIHNNCVRSFPKIKNKTVVLTLHHLITAQRTPSLKEDLLNIIINFPIEKKLIKNSDYIITVSNLTKDTILKYFNYPKEKIKVIPNGVNTEIFHSRNLNEEKFILFPNALREPVRKGTYFLLPTLKEILKKHNIKCIITGKKSNQGEKIEKNLPDGFIYKGLVKIEELSKLYEKAMCVVFPSLYEGYGLVPLEVIASGGVILSSNTGAVKDFTKDKKNGFILQLEEKTWKEKIEEIIKNESLRKKIRENNRNEKVRTWEDSAKEHYEFFKKIS